MGKYEFSFADDSTYQAAFGLLSDAHPGGAVVLDLGCGDAAVARPLTALGAAYVGVDLDQDSITKLVDSGFEGHVMDLSGDDVAERLRRLVRGRRLAAVLCLDVLEHLTEPAELLRALATVAQDSPDVEIVVSIPNVAHVDLARQLLIGNWTPTETGLLDRTHVRFFTDRTLTELMACSGWYESARQDLLRVRSDQHLPNHPAFGADAALARFTSLVRSGPDGHGEVNQFVRRYHRGAVRRSGTSEPGTAPFLSIVLRTQGRRPETLAEVLCCLAAQTEPDFEVVLVVHGPDQAPATRRLVEEFDGNIAQRVRVVPCAGGGRSRPANVGLRLATGEYVAFLDDDDLVLAHWVETFKRGALEHPGMVVRSWAAEQHREWSADGGLATHAPTGPLIPLYAKDFDIVRHVRQNETPIHCFAFPRALRDLGLELDESVTVCEDWQFFMRAASLCGVHDTRQLTAIYNKWSEHSSAQLVHAGEWSTMRSMIHTQLDRAPFLLPPGSISQLDRMLESLGRLETAEAEALAYRQVAENALQAIDELRGSTSWKVSAPLRAARTLGRRISGRLRGRR